MNQEELVSNFAINYLKKRGYTEEDILDENGDMKPELQDHIKKLILKKDPQQLFSDYEEDPDGTVDKVINEEDNEVVSAKKGGYLLKLKKGKATPKKCGCGCNMIEVKAEGGTMISKCACNCKGGKVDKKESGGLIQKLAGGQAVMNPKVVEWLDKPIYHGRPGAVINSNLNLLTPIVEAFNNRVNDTRVSTQGANIVNTKIDIGLQTDPLAQFRSNEILNKLKENESGTQVISYGTDPSILNNIFKNTNGSINVPEGIVSKPGVKPIITDTTATTGIANPNASIVDYLKSIGLNNGMVDRKLLAKTLGIENYKGTAEQNLDFIARMKNIASRKQETPLKEIAGITQTRPIEFVGKTMVPNFGKTTNPHLMKKGGNFIKQVQVKPKVKPSFVPNFETKKPDISNKQVIEKVKKAKPNFKVKPKK